MFVQYAKNIGTEIYRMIKNDIPYINHPEEYYLDFGLSIMKLKLDMRNNAIRYPLMVMDFDYYYITDYKVTKYVTFLSEGKMQLFDYDFNCFFPVKCRPCILIIGSGEEEVLYLENIICNCLKNGINTMVPHPIISNYGISTKLAMCQPIRISREATVNGVISKLYFEPVVLPWFFAGYDREILARDKRLQKYYIKHLKAVCSVNDNCKSFFDGIDKNDDELIQRTKERLVQINANRACLMGLSGIPNQMSSIDYLNRIDELLNNADLSIKDSVDTILEEERRKQELEAEIKRREENQKMAQDNRFSREPYYDDSQDAIVEEIREQTRRMERLEEERIRTERKLEKERMENERRLEAERKKREQQKERDEKHRRALESQRAYDAVVKANQERRRKGQPELPLPHREYY